MDITAADVAKLRQQTGVGMMEAKKALTEAGGNFEQAVDLLRKSGAAKAAKRAERATAQGRVECYSHGGGTLGVMVEVQSETDFVARNDQFIAFCHDLAMHIAAANPLYINKEDVPAELIEKEKEIARGQIAEEGGNKPAEIVEKIVEGKINKYLQEIVLMDQAFIKDDSMTIRQLLESKILSIGENLKIARFSRMQIGE
ncbi:MAG: translation elongation factor Ts [Patescibacteria group bacterium]|jgi:elongation factor Ts